MLTLRPMSEADFEAVARLDVLAFSPYFQHSGIAQEFPPRTHDNLRACLNIFPGGCWVAVADEQPVGYVFSRVWGKLGWLGVFGVSPEAQGQRIGQRLLATVVQALQAAGCETVGLETMPDSPYNVGLYASQGFWITAPTLNLHKEFTTPPPTAAYTCLSDVDLAAALAAVARVSDAVQPGLDYTAEVGNAHEYQWGETLLFGWPETWGFAVVRTIARRTGQNMAAAEVCTLAVQPDAKSRYEEALQMVETFATHRGWSKVMLSVNALDGETLQRTLASGYRVFNVRLRMVYQQGYTQPAGIDLSRWKM